MANDSRQLAWDTEWLLDRLLEERADKRADESALEALDRAYVAAAPWSDVPLFEVPERAPVAESVPTPIVERSVVCVEQEPGELEEPVEAFEQPKQAEFESAKVDRWTPFKRKSLAEKRVSRQQKFAHKLDLLGDKGNYTVSAIQMRGQVERATLQGRGESAYARRQVETDPNVLADRLTRQRRRATLIAGLLIVGAMAFTSVNVHEFLAGSADDWSALWVTGWLVDPVLTGLVVWLLWTRADMAAVNLPISKEREPFIYRVMIAVELITLAATIVMNVIPELSKDNIDPGRVVIHIFIPLVGVGAIFALPYVQSFYADRINIVTGASSYIPVAAQNAQNSFEQPKDGDSDSVSERVQIGVAKVRQAIESKTLALPLSINKVASFIRSSEIGRCSIPTAQEIVRHLQNDLPKLTAN